MEASQVDEVQQKLDQIEADDLKSLAEFYRSNPTLWHLIFSTVWKPPRED